MSITSLTNLMEQLKKHEFFLLLIGLLLQLILPSFISDESVQRVVRYLLVSYTVLISTLIFFDVKRPVITGLVTVLTVALVINWLSYFFSSHNSIAMVRKLVLGLIYGYILYRIILEFSKRGNITFDFILGAVCGYLLIGFLGAIYSTLLIDLHPGSIGFASDSPSFSGHLYYNFVILSTLGFGDITPQNHMAQVHSLIVVIFGQLYLTIALAMIVGRYLSGKQ